MKEGRKKRIEFDFNSDDEDQPKDYKPGINAFDITPGSEFEVHIINETTPIKAPDVLKTKFVNLAKEKQKINEPSGDINGVADLAIPQIQNEIIQDLDKLPEADKFHNQGLLRKYFNLIVAHKLE